MTAFQITLAMVVFTILGTATTTTAQTANSASASKSLAKETLAYVGTYTGGKSQGIYLFRLETKISDASQDDRLVPLGLAAEIASPAFLEIDAKRRLVFAVNETGEFNGQPTGGVSAFAIDPATGKLKLLNQCSSMGAGPCHLILDRAGRHVFVANYGSGSVAVLPVAPDGRLGEASDVVQHEGKSVNPQRQEGPHAHCVTLDPANRFLFVCDLGLDKVMIYKFDAASGRLTANEPAFAAVAPGAGPRHMVFRPDGRFAYVVNELNSTITAFEYDADTGALKELQSVSTLPENFAGPNTCAEIGIHPSGKFVYASNRGHDSVVLLSVDPDKGTLSYVKEQLTGGKTPRHFGIHPAGTHLAIANQNSDTLVLCRIDQASGRLQPSNAFAEAPTPSCIQFLPPADSAR
jgi:6-phosphogluconolactonase